MLNNKFTILNELVEVKHNHQESNIESHVKNITRDEDGGIFSNKGNDVYLIYRGELHPDSASDGARVIFDTIENWAYTVEHYPGFKELTAVNNVIVGRALMRLNFSMLDNGLYDYNMSSDNSFMVSDYCSDRQLFQHVVNFGDVEKKVNLSEGRFRNIVWRQVKDYYVFAAGETVIASHVIVDSIAAEFKQKIFEGHHGGDVWDMMQLSDKENAYNVEIGVIHDLNLKIAGTALKYLD